MYGVVCGCVGRICVCVRRDVCGVGAAAARPNQLPLPLLPHTPTPQRPQQDRFIKLGIRPPKGVLLYGPPGTGKTLIARACAAQTNATFLKLAGPQLVQMFIGDGAKMVRDAFALAKEKQPAIIFIDEVR